MVGGSCPSIQSIQAGLGAIYLVVGSEVLGAIGVSTGWASDRLKQSTRRSMNAIWDRYADVAQNSSQSDAGALHESRIAHALPRTVRCSRSARPFWAEVWGA